MATYMNNGDVSGVETSGAAIILLMMACPQWHGSSLDLGRTTV